MSTSKIYLVAGEASGDSHGAALMRSLRSRRLEVRFLGAGGPLMQRLAEPQFLEWTSHAVIGLVEVLRNYSYFKAQLDRMVEEVGEVNPEAVVFLDYPGFNLRLAAKLRETYPQIRLIYYISPQVWAWNKGRIPKMARILDLMLCIFPFEKHLYEASGLKTCFVGHPMIDTLAAERIDTPRDPRLIGLFPGSRVREVNKIFPAMLSTLEWLRGRKPELRFQVAAANEDLAELMRQLLRAAKLSEADCEIRVGEAHPLMQQAWVAMLASGTATMEATFYGLPYAIVYRVAWGSYLAAKMLIKLEFIGMANILAGKEVVREFIQHEAKAALIGAELLRMIEDSSARDKVCADLAEVIARLGAGGASDHAAEAILDEIG